MGDKQIHPPHGQGAFDPVGPSGDAVQGGQVTDVVSGGKQAHPPHGIGANSNSPSGDGVAGSQVTDVVDNPPALKEQLQNGLDGELVRIEQLESQLAGATGAHRTAIEQAIKSHRDFADLLRRQAKERGWTLSENSPRRIGRKIMKAAMAIVTGATLLGGGFLFASRDDGRDELVADAAPAVEEFLPRTDTEPRRQTGPASSGPAGGPVGVVMVDRPDDDHGSQSLNATSGAANDEDAFHADGTYVKYEDAKDEDPGYDETTDEEPYEDESSADESDDE